MGVYIQLPSELKKLSNDTTSGEIKNALGYTPADAESVQNIVDDESDVFYVTDPNGNIIAKIDSEGIHTTEVNLGKEGETVVKVKEHIQDGKVHITEEERAKWNDNSSLKNITDDESNAFNITDPSGNIIATIDKDGIHTVEMTLGNENEVKVKVKEHINDTDCHVTEDEKTAWDSKSDFDGKYSSLEGIPDAATAKESLGLDQVDNTSDKDKPVSTAQQTALDNLQKTMSEQIVSESEEWHVVDKNGNIVATIDANGLHTTDVTLSDIGSLKTYLEGLGASDDTVIDLGTINSGGTGTFTEGQCNSLLNNYKTVAITFIEGSSTYRIKCTSHYEGTLSWKNYHFYSFTLANYNGYGTVYDRNVFVTIIDDGTTLTGNWKYTRDYLDTSELAYIKSISLGGDTLTYEKGNGTTGTVQLNVVTPATLETAIDNVKNQVEVKVILLSGISGTLTSAEQECLRSPINRIIQYADDEGNDVYLPFSGYKAIGDNIGYTFSAIVNQTIHSIFIDSLYNWTYSMTQIKNLYRHNITAKGGTSVGREGYNVTVMFTIMSNESDAYTSTTLKTFLKSNSINDAPSYPAIGADIYTDPVRIATGVYYQKALDGIYAYIPGYDGNVHLLEEFTDTVVSVQG